MSETYNLTLIEYGYSFQIFKYFIIRCFTGFRPYTCGRIFKSVFNLEQKNTTKSTHRAPINFQYRTIGY